MAFSVKIQTLKSEWSVVYIEGSQDSIPKHVFLSLKIANSKDPDEMPHLKCSIMWHFIWVDSKQEDPDEMPHLKCSIMWHFIWVDSKQ